MTYTVNGARFSTVKSTFSDTSTDLLQHVAARLAAEHWALRRWTRYTTSGVESTLRMVARFNGPGMVEAWLKENDICSLDKDEKDR